MENRGKGHHYTTGMYVENDDDKLVLQNPRYAHHHPQLMDWRVGQCHWRQAVIWQPLHHSAQRAGYRAGRQPDRRG